MILKCVTLLYFFCEAERLPKLRFILFYSNTENRRAELAPLHTFLSEHGEVIGRSSLRFILFYSNTKKLPGGARSASYFFIRTRKTVGRSLLRFILFIRTRRTIGRSPLRFILFYPNTKNRRAEFALLNSFYVTASSPTVCCIKSHN